MLPVYICVHADTCELHCPCHCQCSCYIFLYLIFILTLPAGNNSEISLTDVLQRFNRGGTGSSLARKESVEARTRSVGEICGEFASKLFQTAIFPCALQVDIRAYIYIYTCNSRPFIKQHSFTCTAMHHIIAHPIDVANIREPRNATLCRSALSRLQRPFNCTHACTSSCIFVLKLI